MLIVIAHGSRNLDWQASVERQIEAVRTEVGPEALRLAYMDLCSPTLLDVVADAASRGVTHIRVLPLFLTREGHVDKDVVPLVHEVREAFASLRVELLEPLGQQPLFRDLLRKLAAEVQ